MNKQKHVDYSITPHRKYIYRQIAFNLITSQSHLFYLVYRVHFIADEALEIMAFDSRKVHANHRAMPN